MRGENIVEKIIYDTDIGTDIDDSFALAYLLARDDCELVGITTVSGEAEKRAELASAICCNAGRKDIPIYPGCSMPLIHKPVQAFAKQYARITPFERRVDFEKYSAVDFMRRTIRENPGEITLLAVGALTNVALLFSIDPEIPSLLKRMVIMGAHFGFDPADGAVSEWNMRCDKHAAEIVFNNTPADFMAVSADVTRKIKMKKQEHEEYLSIPLLRPVFAFAEEWFKKTDTVCYHDPLAAALVFDPSFCTYERGNVTMNMGQTNDDLPYTEFTPDPDGKVLATKTVDIEGFLRHYYETVGRIS